MIDIFFKPVIELVGLLLKIRPEISKARQRKLNQTLARLYFLLVELRDSSVYFLNWLEHAERFSYPFYFAQALKILPTIQAVVIKITELMDREFANEFTLYGLLSTQDYELARQLEALIGHKLERLYLWERVLAKVVNYAQRTADSLEMLEGKFEENTRAKVLIPVDGFNIPPMNRYSDFLQPPNTDFVEVHVNRDLLTGEIEKTKETIKVIEHILQEYQSFLKETVSLEDLLG